MGLTKAQSEGIADDAVGANQLASNAVVNASVASNAAISGSKIAPDFGSQNVTTTGTVSDSKGNLRNVPQVTTTSNLVVVASHASKHLLHNGTGGWTINTSTGFAVGDLVTFINNTGSAQSIFQASGVTLYDTADGATGDHSVAARGMVTGINVAVNVFYLSGNIE